MASLPAAIPNRYFVGNDQETAGACLGWLRDNVLWPDDALGTGPRPTDAFDRIDALAATAPVGSGSVIFTPWLNGERTPVDDHTMRGVVGEPVAVHDARRPGPGRARGSRVQHAVAARRGGEVRRTARLDPIRVIGGGAQSALWRQIHADVLDRTIELVADPQSANVRGAGFLGLVGLGRATFDELGRSVAIGDVARPDASGDGDVPAARPGVPDLLPPHQVHPRPPQRLTDVERGSAGRRRGTG